MRMYFIILISVCLMIATVAIAEDVNITLNDSNTSVSGEGAQVNESGILITKPGTYVITGKLTDGSIIIDCPLYEIEDEKVILRLNGVDINCSFGPAIYCINCAKRLSITTVAGTENILSDSLDAVLSDDVPQAVIYSKADVTIGGYGTLRVIANRKNGIVSKDDLRIKENITLFVNSKGHGISGKDSVEILGGNITIIAGEDGIRSMNEESGSVSMLDGLVEIVCSDDPIVASKYISIEGGTLHIVVNHEN